MNLLKYEQRRFAKGQLLTHEDLNALWLFLEPQDRLTRISLIGAGIFYGLNITIKGTDVDGRHSIVVSKGAGVSSEGHLFFLENDQTFYLNGLYNIATNPFKLARLNKYHASGDINAYEWTPANTQSAVVVPADMDEILKTHCFLLYYFENKTNGGSGNCFASFTQQGEINGYDLRLLAIPTTDLEKIWKNQPQATGNSGVPKEFPYVQRLKLWDLVNVPGTPNAPVPNVALGALREAYRTLCTNAVSPAANTDGAVTKLVRTVFDGTVADAFKKIIENFPVERLQYLHDYLKDIVAAYEEWVLANPNPERIIWCPNQTDFPVFLALGTDPGCRMKRYYPGIPGDGTVQHQDALKQRLEAMITLGNVQLNASLPEVKITASRHKHTPLREQAIPFYYRNDQLRPLWNPALTDAGRTDDIPSYYPQPSPTVPPFDQPLSYDLEKYDFFRIEGHIGRPLKEGLSHIEALRNTLNLPFKIIALRIDTAANIIVPQTGANVVEIKALLEQMQFRSFAKDHPGMEHMGGVPKGGTFIVVFQEVLKDFNQDRFNILISKSDPSDKFDILYLESVLQRTIVADFCLPYGCYEGPNMQYIFNETPTVSQSPIALFNEKARRYHARFPILRESAEKEAEVFASITLSNQSMNAEEYIWEAGGTPQTIQDKSDFSTPDQSLEHIKTLPLSLTAQKTGGKDANKYTQNINLCPEELSLFFLEGGVEREELIINDIEPVVIPIQVSPAGGVLIHPDLLDVDIIKLSPLPSKLSAYQLTINEKTLNGIYTLRYRFCEGVERQIRLIVNRGQFRPEDVIALEIPVIDDQSSILSENISQTVKDSPAFTKTSDFLKASFADTGTLTGNFEPVVRAIAGKLNNADKTVRKDYALLLVSAAKHFLNAATVLAKGQLPEDIKTALENLRPILDRAGMSGEALLRQWDVTQLKNSDNAAVINEITKLLTP